MTLHGESHRRSLRRREQRALRRLMPRKLLVLTVQGGGSTPMYGIVNDISDSGAGIVADECLSSGQEVRLRICFYPQVSYDTDARVVWGKDDSGAATHGLALNGVQFAGPLDLNRLATKDVVASDGIVESNGHLPRDSATAKILEYLENQIPDYPFSRKLDGVFVEELLVDFPNLDILEEVKTFRWHYDNDPVARVLNPRASLRRWVSSSSHAGPVRRTREPGAGRFIYDPGLGTDPIDGGVVIGDDDFDDWMSFLKE